MDVLTAWGLERASVDLVAGGASNLTWRVTADDDVWFLRRYRTDDPGAIAREQRLIAHAVARHIPTPLPRLTVAGYPTALDDAGHRYALFPEARGESLEPALLTLAHAAAAGRFLGNLHRALSDADRSGWRVWTLEWAGAAWARRIRDTVTSIPDSGSADDEWARRRALAQAAWLEHPDCRHRYVPTSPSQVLHGDFQHANLLFAETEVVGVLDWDTACVMPPAFEVARACGFMFAVEPTRTRAFVDGYREANDLSVAALADGAAAWGCFADHHVWPLEQRYRWGNTVAARFIPHLPFRPFEQAWADADVR